MSIGDVQNDMSCCKNRQFGLHDTGDVCESDDDNGDDNDDGNDLIHTTNNFDSDFSDFEIQTVQYINVIDDENKSDLDSKVVLRKVAEECFNTPVEKKNLSFQDTIISKINDFDKLYHDLSVIIKDIGNRSFPKDAKYTNKNKTDFLLTFIST